MEKSCTLCRAIKPLDEFPLHRSRPDGRSVWCKPCHAARSKRWRENNLERSRQAAKEWHERNPDNHRPGHLRRTYGIELETYEALLAQQSGGCAICGRVEADTTKKHLCVDHVAGTGTIRGLLCAPCNSAIGLMAHDAERLRVAILYLSQPPVAEGRFVGRGIQRGAQRKPYRVRTHCRNGHEYTEANTSLTKAGIRRCRACSSAAYRNRAKTPV